MIFRTCTEYDNVENGCAGAAEIDEWLANKFIFILSNGYKFKSHAFKNPVEIQTEVKQFKIVNSGKSTYNESMRSTEFNLNDSLWSVGSLLFNDKIEGFATVSQPIEPSALQENDCIEQLSEEENET